MRILTELFDPSSYTAASLFHEASRQRICFDTPEHWSNTRPFPVRAPFGIDGDRTYAKWPFTPWVQDLQARFQHEDLGHEVIVIDPRKAKAVITSNKKTDKLDARNLAR